MIEVRKSTPKFQLTPARVLVLGYFSLIILGTLLLYLPPASAGGERCSFIDSLFTSTSGVCVTGLIVRDTEYDFSPLGKLVILILIQIGGLGYMTLATVFSLFLGRKISLRERLVVQQEFNQLTLEGLARFALRVFKVTVVLEALGALILSVRFWLKGIVPIKAIAYGIFHGVSAFCNAGFSLFSRNLTEHTSDAVVVLTVSTLFVLGGLGFIVISDVYKRYARKEVRSLSVHSKFVILLTLLLVSISTLGVGILEWKGMLGSLSPLRRVMNAYFQGVTPRTAGFSTVSIGALASPTLFLLIVMMFIGASPGGTGGGIKTTTFGTIVVGVCSTLRGRKNITMFERRIPRELLERALIVFVLSLGILVVGTGVLSLTQKEALRERGFLGLLFEETSAFGTVGLSTGSYSKPTCSLSHDFSPIGKLIIIFTMIFGRIGPITIGVAALAPKREAAYSYPESKILIG